MKHKLKLRGEEGVSDVKRQKSAEMSLKGTENGKSQEIFTSLEFKNLLKEPGTRIQALNEFSKACKNGQDKLDIVKSYISSSPDCVEIFKCINTQSSPNELGAVFRSILNILSRTTSDLKELYGKVGENVCGSIIQSHLVKIYHALSLKQSPRTGTIALKLLTMMVMQGVDVARELVNNLDFSLKCFKEILDKNKGKLGYETRLAYIKFVMSFFVTDDSRTIQKALEAPGLVSVIFKQIKNDPASIVQLVLMTLKEKAVKNLWVSKSAKARFFANPKVLANISTLFDWDGAYDLDLTESEESTKDLIRNLVYEFLYHSCCPFKYGINFKDPSLGKGDKCKNHVLLDFAFHLVSLSSDPLVCDLLVEIMKACPDLLPRFMSNFRLSLEPKDSEIWLRNFDITKKVYESQPDVAIALMQFHQSNIGSPESVEHKLDPEFLVKMAVPGIFSPNFNAQILKYCLKDKSVEIRQGALSLMQLFLRKLQISVEFTSDVKNSSKNEFSEDNIDDFLNELNQYILKNCISVSVVVTAWRETCKGDQSDIKNGVLKILCLLQEIFPDAVKDLNFDFTKLLFGISEPQDTNSETEPGLLLIKMFLKSPQRYKWFKIVENGHSPFRRLIQIIYDTKNKESAMYKTCVALFKSILICNNVLSQANSLECDIWIKSLPSKVKTHNDIVILDFVSDICGQVVRIPVKFSDILITNEEHNDNDDSSPDTAWDTIPEVEIKPASSDLSSCTQTKRVKDFENFRPGACSISLITVAAFETLATSNKLGSEEKHVLDGYLSNVFHSLFHTLPGSLEASLFQSVFTSLLGGKVDLESEYQLLHNLKTFLSIWGGEKSSANYQHISPSADLRTYTQDWFWRVTMGKKQPRSGELLKKFLSECQEKDIVDVGILFSQILLHFDTINSKDEGNKAKELICVTFALLNKAFEINSDHANSDNDNPNTGKISDDEKLWILRRFLTNRGIQQIFLDDFSSETIDLKLLSDVRSTSKKDLKLCTVSTAVTIEVLKELYMNLKVPYDGTLKFFISKLVQATHQLLQKIGSPEAFSFPKHDFAIYAIIKDLQSIFPASVLQTIFDDISNTVEKINSKTKAKFMSTMLSLILKSLLDKGVCSINHDSMKKVFKYVASSKYLKFTDEMYVLLTQLMDKIPNLAVVADHNFVSAKNCSIGQVGLISKLVQFNPSLMRDFFVGLNLEEMTEEEKVVIIPVVNEILKFVTHVTSDNFSEEIIKKILDGYEFLFTPDGASYKKLSEAMGCDIKRSFVRQYLHMGMKHGLENLEKIVKPTLGLENWRHYEEGFTSYARLIVDLADQAQVGSNVQSDAISALISSVITSCMKDVDSVKAEKIFSFIHYGLEKLNESDFSGLRQKISDTSSCFFKHVLKNHFTNIPAMKCVLKLIPVVFSNLNKDSERSVDVSPAMLRDMLISHSKFLQSFLDPGPPAGEDLKELLSELLLDVTLHCDKEDLTENDLTFLFGAYNATLCSADQNILKTILLYEKKGLSFLKLKPFLWGQPAISSHHARKNLGDTLWKRPGSSEVLSCLNSDIMDATLKRFPLRRRMIFIDQEVENDGYFQNDPSLTILPANNHIKESKTEAQSVYDPAFLLPVIMDVLSPENLVDCKTFVRSGTLSFLMACLGSHCSSVRSTSATCLSMYYHHAQSAWFPENNLTMYLIRCIRNSIETKNMDDGTMVIPRLPSVVSNFLSGVVRLHQTPEDHMFSVLHRFLLVKPALDLKNIPEFYVLFFSAEMEFKIERTWVLNLIAEGLRDMGDYHAIARKNVFQLIMCLHDSPISDNFVRRQIFQILEQACSIRSCVFDLVKKHGLVSWLIQASVQQPSRSLNTIHAIGSPGKRQENTFHIIKVASALWKTLNLKDFIADDHVETDEKDETNEDTGTNYEKHASLAPFRVVKQLIHLCFSLLENMNLKNSDEVFKTNLVQYYDETLSILTSCLSNLDERRKLNRMRRAAEIMLEDLCDVDTRHINTLLSAAKFLCEHKHTNSVNSIVKALTFWANTVSENNSKLWKNCISFIFTDAFLFWSQTPDWIRINFLRLLKWLESMCLQVPCTSEDHLLIDKCYGVACCYTVVLENKFYDSLLILNRMLEKYEQRTGDINAGDDVFRKMQCIRNHVHLGGAT